MGSQALRSSRCRRPPPPQTLLSKLTFAYSHFPPSNRLKFLPEVCIDRLVSREAVIEELFDDKNPFEPEHDEALIQWILHKGRKLLLTILDTRIAKNPTDNFDSLDCFQAHGVNDDQLPWTDSSRFHPIVDAESEPWFHDTWSLHMDCFERSQWMFLVPVITSNQFIYRLQAEQILPFLQVDGEPKAGAFGRVYCVEVEPSHIDIGFPIKHIAVKEITSLPQQHETVAEAWPNEVRVLEKTRSLGDPHLITCIAAIERGNERFLLFPWAQNGNLREYWETLSERFDGGAAITEALVQLKGISTALRQLHYFGLPDDSTDLLDNVKDEYEQAVVDKSIRHGDLKPENLLWFLEEMSGSKRRYLKIADMGLAKRHVIATQDRSCLTSTRYGTILYEAPEAQTSVSARSRQYDVWSMGCITLEWIIWILYGNSQLQRFYSHLKGYGNNFTPYYQLDSQRRAKVHPAILHWISHIKATHPECQQESAIKDLLQLVEERLLVVPLPVRRPTTWLNTSGQSSQSRSDAQEDPTRPRATSKEFEYAMTGILEKVRRSESYLLRTSNLRSSTPPPDYTPLLHPEMGYVAGKASTLGKGLVPPSTDLRKVRMGV